MNEDNSKRTNQTDQAENVTAMAIYLVGLAIIQRTDRIIVNREIQRTIKALENQFFGK